LNAALLLNASRRSLYSVPGGGSAVAQSLANSIKQSGGKIRLDTPVLRLAQDVNGRAVGVDLLSGEQLGASRAVISNLTVWDTYGKLIGLSKAPTEFRKELGTVNGRSAYAVSTDKSRAPEGQCAVTIHTATESGDWFVFHEDEADVEAQDQAMLEECWHRLHAAIPELGGDIEVTIVTGKSISTARVKHRDCYS
jgi:phytoene dehydrogenase-like protein